MLQKKPANEAFKQIDQRLEDFAGDEMDEFDNGYDQYAMSHKHYSAEEEACMNIDELY